MRNRLFIFAIAILCGLSSAPARAQVLNAKLKNKKHEIRTVLVFPSQVRVATMRRNLFGHVAPNGEPGDDTMDALVRRELQLRGATVLPAPSIEDLDEETADLLANVRAKYDSIKMQIRKKPGDVPKGRYTIGDLLAAYPAADNAELVVFVDGAPAPHGKVSIGFGSPYLYANYLTFIDPKTGEVVAFCSFTTDFEPRMGMPVDMLRSGIRDSIRNLPFHYSADFAAAMYESSRNSK